MSLNLKGNGRAIAKLGGPSFHSQLIYVDPTDTTGMKVINTQKKGEGSILTQVPSIDTRETLYIAGRSGSGKSTYAKEYIKNYSKLFPDNKIYLISKVDDDEAFKDLKNIIKINQDLFDPENDEETDYDAKQFQNCLVIFDDIDQFIEKIKKKISLLRDQLLEIGRHDNVYVISTSHLLTNYKHTRVLLNEAHSVTFFPQSGFYNIERYLKQYAGLSNENINQIKISKSRWVTVFQSYPQVIMEEHKIYIP